MSDESRWSDASDRFACSVCGRSLKTCKGHPRHLFTPERNIHVLEKGDAGAE